MGRRALLTAVDDTLREMAEGGGNFVGEILAFEIAFLAKCSMPGLPD